MFPTPTTPVDPSPMPRSILRAAVRIARLLAVGALVLPTAVCDDGTGPEPLEGRVLGVVLNSVDVSVTIFDAGSESPSAPVTVGLAPDGSPVSMAVRGRLAAVPLGTVPAVAVVDVEAGTLVRTVALPEGSGATGVAFVDDSIAVVANPSLNSVSPVNVRTGEVAAEVPVGRYPQGVVGTEHGTAVVNARLGPDFLPVGPGTLTFLAEGSLDVRGTVELGGVNPGAAAVGPDGRLYVIISGTFGGGDGSLSVVDAAALEEVAHHAEFGEFPFSAAFGPGGRLHVGSFGYGIAVWDPTTLDFTHPPDAAIAPEGVPSVASLGFDPDGRLYALRPDCQGPSAALRLGADFTVERTIPVGTCPIAIAFTEVEE